MYDLRAEADRVLPVTDQEFLKGDRVPADLRPKCTPESGSGEIGDQGLLVSEPKPCAARNLQHTDHRIHVVRMLMFHS